MIAAAVWPIERQRDIQQYVSMELSELNEAVVISYHLTSIYDHSVLEAFSKVIQKMVPQLPTLENLLDILISVRAAPKSTPHTTRCDRVTAFVQFYFYFFWGNRPAILTNPSWWTLPRSCT